MKSYIELIEEAKKEFPRVSIVNRTVGKGVPLHLKIVFWFMYKVMSSYSNYVTTIGSTIYVDNSFFVWGEQSQHSVIRHELVHVKQFNTFLLGKKFWPINYFIVGFLYIFILPCFFTFRAYFEREAYTESIRADIEFGRLTRETMRNKIPWYVEEFASSHYFWMMRRNAAKIWVEQTMDKELTKAGK